MAEVGGMQVRSLRRPYGSRRFQRQQRSRRPQHSANYDNWAIHDGLGNRQSFVRRQEGDDGNGDIVGAGVTGGFGDVSLGVGFQSDSTTPTSLARASRPRFGDASAVKLNLLPEDRRRLVPTSRTTGFVQARHTTVPGATFGQRQLRPAFDKAWKRRGQHFGIGVAATNRPGRRRGRSSSGTAIPNTVTATMLARATARASIPRPDDELLANPSTFMRAWAREPTNA